MAEEKKQRLGRPSNNVTIGIVGLPNVGKSSFFNTLSALQVPAENFPFCTIDPNEARVPVPDPRFDWLCTHYEPASKVPAHLNVVDIAGLVKKAQVRVKAWATPSCHTLVLVMAYFICVALSNRRISHMLTAM